MGLPMLALRFLAREHKRKPFTGPVLTLGRQGIYATYEQVRAMLAAEGIEPKALPEDRPLYTNIPNWQDGPNAQFTSDKVFFLTLGGLEVFVLDISDYEGAEYVADLNLCVPPELEGRFGLIIDSGTLEHVFNVKEGLCNVNRMLNPDGRVVHLSPVSNQAEHGYYQFSPSLLYDYYGVNGFTEIQCFLIEHSTWGSSNKRDFWEWDVKRTHSSLISGKLLSVYFCAVKTSDSTVDRVPQQGQFAGDQDVSRTGAPSNKAPNNMLSRIKANMPPKLKLLLRRLLRRDPSTKPWGLKYLGKL